MKKTLPKRIPKYLYHYFWDVDVKKLNPQKYLYMDWGFLVIYRITFSSTLSY